MRALIFIAWLFGFIFQWDEPDDWELARKE
jgi:hypothetical protein